MVFDEKLAINLTEDPCTFTFFQNPLSFSLVVDFAVARCGFWVVGFFFVFVFF